MSSTLAHPALRARLPALFALVSALLANPGQAGADRDAGASSGHDHDDDDDDDDDSAADAGPVGDPADAGAAPDPVVDVDAVGALVDDAQRVFCTGALLTPDTILTAAHCVAQDGVVRWPWGFFLGEDVTLGGQFVRVLDGAVHPAYDPFLHTADLAVLRIAGGAPRSAFLELGAAVPPVGAAVRIFGFGGRAVGPNRRDAEVTSQATDSFRYEPGTCPGDSGGPVLVDEEVPRIAGVVSTGAAGCASARAVAVASHAGWIDDAVAFLDPIECRADGTCGSDCRLGDADCDCVSDDGACRLCAGTDLDCSGSCESDDRCVTNCLAPDPDCRTLQEGARCERDVECASSICFRQECREPCTASTGAGCAPWASCLGFDGDGDGDGKAGDADGVCIPYNDAVVLGGCAAAPAHAGATAGLAHASASAALALLLSAVLAVRRRSARARGPNRKGVGR